MTYISQAYDEFSEKSMIKCFCKTGAISFEKQEAALREARPSQGKKTKIILTPQTKRLIAETCGFDLTAEEIEAADTERTAFLSIQRKNEADKRVHRTLLARKYNEAFELADNRDSEDSEDQLLPMMSDEEGDGEQTVFEGDEFLNEASFDDTDLRHSNNPMDEERVENPAPTHEQISVSVQNWTAYATGSQSQMRTMINSDANIHDDFTNDLVSLHIQDIDMSQEDRDDWQSQVESQFPIEVLLAQLGFSNK